MPPRRSLRKAIEVRIAFQPFHVSRFPARALVLGALAFGVAACGTSPTTLEPYQSALFDRAVSELRRAEKLPLALSGKIPEDMTAREPVVLKLGLADCLELALGNNREILLDAIRIQLADAAELSAGAYDDIRFLGGLDITRSETALQSRFIGDARTKSEQTDENASLDVVRRFDTGTTLRVGHRVHRSITNSPFSAFEWDSGLSLEITQNLLEGFGPVGTRTDFDIAHGEARAARHDAQASNLDVRHSVAAAYWRLILAREDLAVLRRQAGVARLSVERARRRLEQGLDTSIDVLRARSTLAAQEKAIIDAESAAERASDDLLAAIHPDLLHGYAALRGFRLGVEPPADALDAAPPPPDYELNTQVLLALSRRPDLKAAKIRLENLGLRVRQREQAMLPDLNLVVGSDFLGFGADYPDTLKDIAESKSRRLVGGLTFEIPLENSADRGALRSALAQREQALLAARNTETAIILDVVNAVRDITAGRKAIEASRVASELAREEYEAEVNRRDNGLSTSFEVEAALSNQTSADRDLVRARVQLELARLALLRANGALVGD